MKRALPFLTALLCLCATAMAQIKIAPPSQSAPVSIDPDRDSSGNAQGTPSVQGGQGFSAPAPSAGGQTGPAADPAAPGASSGPGGGDLLSQ